MLMQNVIQLSHSPWASPIVLVQKKDGCLWFCMDYQSLNAVTKSDRSLSQGLMTCWGTWSISQYSTWLLGTDRSRWVKWYVERINSIVTQHGLLKFYVMPFGLTNSPAVFQQFMHEIVSTLNPMGGSSFVTIYIDDLLVYFKTLEDHLHHLGRVMDKLREVNLKLQPAKCHF